MLIEPVGYYFTIDHRQLIDMLGHFVALELME